MDPPLQDDIAEEMAEALLQSLPTCDRCKRLRRKCDTRLPACRRCALAGLPCEVKDIALGILVPRSHIKTLLDRWMDLQRQQTALQINGLSDTETNQTQWMTPTSGSPSQTTVDRYLDTPEQVSTQSSKNTPEDRAHTDLGEFDGHYPKPGTNGNDFVFFGSASAVALATELLLHACPQSHLIDYSGVQKAFQAETDTPSAITILVDDIIPSENVVVLLLEKFSTSINLLYPIVGLQTIEDDLTIFQASLRGDSVATSNLPEANPYANFRLAIMCSIACAIEERYKSWLAAYEHVFYARALAHVEEVMHESSSRSLQALLLIIIYYLFRPRKGDIWMLLDTANRLSIELGYHAEDPLQLEGEDQIQWKRNIFWTLYTIERTVGQLFGRPSDMLESILTVKYPTPVTLDDYRETNRRNDISDIYHLAFLRSQMYTELYLPSAALQDTNWYREQISRLAIWHNQIPLSTQYTDVRVIACNIAYHSTIILLFQKVLLRAISDLTRLDQTISIIAIDSYRSACCLIEIYEDIISGGHHSDVETYPLTFIAAHEIFSASLTILGFCCLSIDGRFATQQPYVELEFDGNPGPRDLDYSKIHQTSASCLALLTWCATQWQGMEGMVEIYKDLSATVLPKLVRMGLAS